MKRAIAILAVICASQWSAGTWAATRTDAVAPDSSTENSQQFPSYFEIEEPQANKSDDGFRAPDELLQLAVSTVVDTAANLLTWDHENQSWPAPDQRYDRMKQFGGWKTGASQPACENTRALALIRDSQAQVEMSDSGCVVRSGKWHDPYTGNDFESAGDMQIDHMVPLKNAYISGASKWDQATRCAYTNFMSNNFHLLSVNGRQNQAKGDSTPADWLPPNAAFHCQYLKDWLSVKLIWKLILSPDESDAIKGAYAAAHCDPNDFTISADELRTQRQAVQAAVAHCQ